MVYKNRAYRQVRFLDLNIEDIVSLIEEEGEQLLIRETEAISAQTTEDLIESLSLTRLGDLARLLSSVSRNFAVQDKAPSQEDEDPVYSAYAEFGEFFAAD